MTNPLGSIAADLARRSRTVLRIINTHGLNSPAMLLHVARCHRDRLQFRRRSKTAIGILRAHGVRSIPGVIRIATRHLKDALCWPNAAAKRRYRSPTIAPTTLLVPRVLIVASLDIPQCVKYRVNQKQRLFELLGVPCTVIDWRDASACRNAIQTHSMVIFYRVPGFDDVLDLVVEARRLGLPTFYEVDDLIFDRDAYLANRNLENLPAHLRQSVLDGVPLFLKALQRCEFGIASTPELAAKMGEFGLRQVHVVENGIDDETLALVAMAENGSSRDVDLVRIFYGSGSKAHDADFAEAAPALLELALAHPNVRIRIAGELTLPASFAPIAAQIERFPVADYATYLTHLASCDVNLAPLEPSIFNDCKSNIKFIEAALFGIPSVCSPRAAFRSAVVSGENGFLAAAEAQWREALERLTESRALREAMGQKARQSALARYSAASLAARDLRPIAAAHLPAQTAPTDGLRVLTANVFFSPESFGGGTIIAEEMAVRLNAKPGIEVVVFSGLHDPAAEPYEVVRHEVKGLPIVSVKVPSNRPPEFDFLNRTMKAHFADVLTAFRPDVVHLHAVQSLSASIGEACLEAGVPYVVTLHDAWWLCERQFMVRPDSRYCGQTRIDLAICQSCVPNVASSDLRTRFMRSVLNGAARVLAPSEFWKRLHVANGISPDQILVNKNGIRPPHTLPAAKPSGPARGLRFGFVGGIGPVKGLDLIVKAFREIAATDYDLVLVDNTLNLGFSSLHAATYKIPGRLTVVPAYTQDTIDTFFSGIDVLLFPSQWRESFGLTVREALIRDKWVILTDSGGTVEDIVDGENGTIIPLDGGHSGLKVAIENLLADQDAVLSHTNRHKGQIRTFDEQADELAGILRSSAFRDGRKSGDGSAPVGVRPRL